MLAAAEKILGETPKNGAIVRSLATAVAGVPNRKLRQPGRKKNSSPLANCSKFCVECEASLNEPVDVLEKFAKGLKKYF